jgi:hypothetical protein
LIAGTASTVLHVIPTTTADVTSLASQASTLPTAVDVAEPPFVTTPIPAAPAVVVARALAGASPVFGAPIAWTDAAGAQVKGTGDALVIPTFSNSSGPANGGNGQAPAPPSPTFTATLGTSTTTAAADASLAGSVFQAVDAAGPFVPLTP